MKTRVMTFIGIAALVIGAVVFAVAQEGPGGQGRPGQPPPPPPPFGVPSIEHLAQALNLTDAQSAELKPFLDSERQTIDALVKKMEEQHKQINESTAQGRFDEAQVRALATQGSQTMVDLIVEQERVKAKIYNTLTPEQRVRMEELHRRGGPHGHPPGPPPNGAPQPPPPPGE